MALTKADIIYAFRNQIGLSKKEASNTVEFILKTIKGSLAEGEAVMISRFGKFLIRAKNARKGRNPKTGETCAVTARKVVTFKCSGSLRKRVNNE